MRCRTCEYRLWNLPERRCPECGTPFRPSDFEFVPNTVQFCCPHCDQAYYGTGTLGHLVPAEFNCRSCGRRIHMDEMVLRPAEGVTEEQTRPFHHPWLERRQQGAIRAWRSTVKMAHVSPARLMRGLPVRSAVGQAWLFAGATLALVAIVLGLSMAIIPVLPAAGAPGLLLGRANAAALIAGCGCLGAVTMFLIALVFWGLVTHGLLRITGPTRRPIGRTYEALCYSTGANMLSALPCLGLYIGWIWWMVAAVLMVREAQRTSGLRAAVAVLAMPGALVLSVVGFYALLVAGLLAGWGPFRAAGAPAIAQATETQTVLTAVLSYARQHGDRGPDHALQLVSGKYLEASSLVSRVHSTTLVSQVPVADTTLAQFAKLSAEQQAKIVQGAIDALPEGTIAHRLGDHVFVHHGIRLRGVNRGLWLVIMAPDPDANQGVSPTGWLGVGTAGGTAVPVRVEDLQSKLQAQNRLRAQYGLAPLPDPGQVRHGKPAVKKEPGG